MRNVNWKKRLVQAAWLLAGIGTIVLLGAAMQKKSQRKCTDIRIEITGAEQHMFIDEKDIMGILTRNGAVKGHPMAVFNLRTMENLIEKDLWVKNAEMFFDNRQALQIRIEERQPVARIFTIQGNSYYIDSGGLRLPLSDKLSARVPMFTGFTSDRPVLSKPDSALLKDIVKLGRYIMADSFWMAQVAQVAISPNIGFELVPVIGDHTIILGNLDDMEGKFRRLYTFYKQAWLRNGMNTYEKLDLQYSNQVVAVRKGTGRARIDSAAAASLVQQLVNSSANNFTDSAEAKQVVAIAAPAKDTVQLVKTKPTVKAPVKTTVKAKTNTTTNNKKIIKPLTNERKSKPSAKTTKKVKPTSKVTKPKAILQRN